MVTDRNQRYRTLTMTALTDGARGLRSHVLAVVRGVLLSVTRTVAWYGADPVLEGRR
jgi:hypothetical protein